MYMNNGIVGKKRLGCGIRVRWMMDVVNNDSVSSCLSFSRNCRESQEVANFVKKLIDTCPVEVYTKGSNKCMF